MIVPDSSAITVLELDLLTQWDGRATVRVLA